MTVVEQPAGAPEEHLLRFRATRDPAALGALFDATAPALLRVALATAPDPASAENALQETFLAVLAAPERWDETRPAMPWLLGILHRQIGTTRRDRARVPDPLRVPPPLREGDPAAAAASREELERVRAAIEDLPEPYRQVALLRWRHGLEPAEIAHIRSEPPGTTRSLLSRALERLRGPLGALAIGWFGGAAGPRGLAEIQREIVRRARLERVEPVPLAGSLTAASATAAAVAGGVAVKKLVAAIVLLVLVGVATWRAVGWAARDHNTASDESVSANGVAAAETPTRRPRVHPEVAAAEAPVPLPPPVDFNSLDPDRDIAGTVVGPDQAPVAGAAVRVRDHTWKRLGDSLRVEEGPATRTAADGSFRARVEPGAPVSLVVRADGFPEQIRDECRGGQRVTIQLAKGHPVSIEVVDDAGSAVPGARVTLRCTMPYGAEVQTCEAVTGPDGIATAPAVLGPWATIRVAAPGVPGEHWGGTTLVPQDAPKRVVLPRRVTIEGRVTDRGTGAPVAGAAVGVPGHPTRNVTADADGRYVLPAWAWERSVSVAATATGFGTAVLKVERPGTVDFVLDRAFEVRGRVVGEDAAPVPAARVAVLERVTREASELSLCAVAGDDGRFAVAPVTPGAAHVLVVVAPGRQRAIVDLPAAAAGGEPYDVGDVVVPRGRRLAGAVVDADGRPSPGDFVYAVRSETSSSDSTFVTVWKGEYVQADDSGRFRFDALAPGDWLVSLSAVDAPRMEPVRVTMPGDRDVDDVQVVLGGSRTITIRVVDDAGAPVRNASVTLSGDFGWVGRRRTPLSRGVDATGRAVFRGLPETMVFPYANAPMDGPVVPYKRLPDTVPAGQELTIVLERAAAIAGRVVDLDGTPLAGHQIDAFAPGADHSIGIAVTADDGSFRMLVPAGAAVDVRLRGTRVKILKAGVQTSEPSGYEGALSQLRAPAEGLVLRATKESLALDRTLTVVLVDAHGVAVEGIPVDAYWRVSGPGVQRKTDADGRAVLENLPDRKVRVSFQSGARMDAVQGLQVPPDAFEVVPDGQEVRVAYRPGAPIRGRMISFDGKPLRGSVHARTPAYTYVYALADAEGRFTVAGLPDVLHHVEASAWIDGKEWKATRLGVMPGADEIELVLQPPPKDD